MYYYISPRELFTQADDVTVASVIKSQPSTLTAKAITIYRITTINNLCLVSGYTDPVTRPSLSALNRSIHLCLRNDNDDHDGDDNEMMMMVGPIFCGSQLINHDDD